MIYLTLFLTFLMNLSLILKFLKYSISVKIFSSASAFLVNFWGISFLNIPSKRLSLDVVLSLSYFFEPALMQHLFLLLLVVYYRWNIFSAIPKLGQSKVEVFCFIEGTFSWTAVVVNFVTNVVYFC